MGNLIMFLIVLVAVMAAPRLITYITIEALAGLRALMGGVGKLIDMLFKAIGWALMSPVRIAKQLWAATALLSSDYKKSWKTQSAKKQKDIRFKHAMKAKKKNIANAKLAADQHDANFHILNAQLKSMEEKHKQSFSFASAMTFSDELDKPAFLRQGIFQTDHNGDLKRDSFGNPVKTTVLGMFNHPEPDPLQASASPQSEAPELYLVQSHDDEELFLDSDGFGIECDPYAGVA